MKTFYIFLLLSFVSLHSFGQDWIHQGSTWHFYSLDANSEAYQEYKYSKDTILAGKSCHVLTGINYVVNGLYNGPYTFDTIVWPSAYTYSAHDSVFYYYSNAWQAVYFFSTHLGDTILSPSGYTSGSIVDSVSIITINNTPLRYYRFHSIDTCHGYHLQGSALERIGMLYNSIIPYWQECDYESFGTNYFTCYQDDSFALYSTSRSCEYYFYTGIIEESATMLKISPNPANDVINLHFDKTSSPSSVIIYDITGRRLIDKITTSADEIIQVSNLIDGIYLLSIRVGVNTISKKICIKHSLE